MCPVDFRRCLPLTSQRHANQYLLHGLRVRLATLVTLVVTSTNIRQLPRIHRILYLGLSPRIWKYVDWNRRNRGLTPLNCGPLNLRRSVFQECFEIAPLRPVGQRPPNLRTDPHSRVAIGYAEVCEMPRESQRLESAKAHILSALITPYATFAGTAFTSTFASTYETSTL